jgi:hypothetical protein
LQICTHQAFKTTPDLKNKFLRAIQTKNNLPAINEVFPMKHTVDQFRLRFENILQIESWLQFFNENTRLLKSFQSVNLHRTKITLKGIPKQALQHGSKPLIDSLSLGPSILSRSYSSEGLDCGILGLRLQP